MLKGSLFDFYLDYSVALIGNNEEVKELSKHQKQLEADHHESKNNN